MTMHNLLRMSALGQRTDHLTKIQMDDLKNLITMAKFYNYTLEEFIATQFDPEKIEFIRKNWGT